MAFSLGRIHLDKGSSNITSFPCPGFNTVRPQGGSGGFMHHLRIPWIAFWQRWIYWWLMTYFFISTFFFAQSIHLASILDLSLSKSSNKQFPSFTFHKSSTPSKTKSCYWTAIGCHSKPRPLHHTATTSLLPKCLGCATSLVPHCTWSAPWQLPLQPKRVGCESHEDPGWSAQVEFVIPQRVGESM